jgi:TRAP transporter 4TM/12TM fusion protein
VRDLTLEVAMSEDRIVLPRGELMLRIEPARRLIVDGCQLLLIASIVLWLFGLPRTLLSASFYTEQLLSLCLGLALALAFIGNGPQRPSTTDWLKAAASLVICFYIAARYEPLTIEIARLPMDGIIGSAALVYLVLDACRRVSGWGFVVIVLALCVYVFVGPHLPGEFQTRPVSFARLLVHVGLDTNGMIGSILEVVLLVVIPFTIMGQVLARTGGAAFFADLAAAAVGHTRGGSAKIAIGGSAMFGMISGNAVSNVLAVGIVSIPMMVRAGFSPQRAAAIEAVGSTGGQLMPPVMGASAFIMAELLQVSYGAVCLAALIPALLYYACLYIHVDLEAARSGVGAVAVDAADRPVKILMDGWHFVLPIAFLVLALVFPQAFRISPEQATIVSTVLLIALARWRSYRGTTATLREIGAVIIDTGRVSMDIILIAAAAGIMVGALGISGLSFSMTTQLLALSGNNVYALLLLIAVFAFILGIGLPTVSVYILTATLLAPALIKLGVTPMAAHMFVMYNGMLSMITPPVAFAAYAAANIAGASGWRVGWLACVVGWSAFVLPFLFVLTPTLLMDGPILWIVFDLCRTLWGIFVGTAAVIGFGLAPLSKRERLVAGSLSLLVLAPNALVPAYVPVFAGTLALALLLKSRRDWTGNLRQSALRS